MEFLLRKHIRGLDTLLPHLFLVTGRPAKEQVNTNRAGKAKTGTEYIQDYGKDTCGPEVKRARGERKEKGEVSNQPTAQAAYIGKGDLASSRAIGKEGGKKGRTCTKYG